MKEYPKSFMPVMVQAIQDNKKTQTRRIVDNLRKPPCEKGDRLWVQEKLSAIKRWRQILVRV